MPHSRLAVDAGDLKKEHVAACRKQPKEGDVAARPSFRLAEAGFLQATAPRLALGRDA